MNQSHPKTKLQFVYTLRPGRHDDGKIFRCAMSCGRCLGTKANGQRCSRTSCMGYEYCWQHLRSHAMLRIGPSIQLPQAGKGVFAFRRGALPTDVIFRRGQHLIPYHGENVTIQEVNRRYDPVMYAGRQQREGTAPYYHSGVDAACARSIGSMLNHRPRPNMTNVVVRGANRMIVALRDITHDEELFMDYGPSYAFPTTRGGGYSHTVKRRRRNVVEQQNNR